MSTGAWVRVAGAAPALDVLGGETLRVLALVLAAPVGLAIMARGLMPLVWVRRAPTDPTVARRGMKDTRTEHMLDNARRRAGDRSVAERNRNERTDPPSA